MIEGIAARAFAPAAAAVADGRLPGAALGIVTRDGARAVVLSDPESGVAIQLKAPALGRRHR